MKHKNSISQAYIHRDKTVLPELFDLAKACSGFPTTMLDICRLVAEMPVSRFYLSDDTALNYVRRRYRKGIATDFVNPYKQRLYEHLYAIVNDMLKTEKYRRLGLRNAVAVALNSPAPCIGLTPEVIQQKMYERIFTSRHRYKNKSPK